MSYFILLPECEMPFSQNNWPGSINVLLGHMLYKDWNLSLI